MMSAVPWIGGARDCLMYDHDWRRVPDHVHVIGEPVVNEYRNVVGVTYNAECRRCGRRSWLHWRPIDPVLEQEC